MTKLAAIKVVDWTFDESGRIQINKITHMQQDLSILGGKDEIRLPLLRDTREIPQVLSEK